MQAVYDDDHEARLIRRFTNQLRRGLTPSQRVEQQTRRDDIILLVETQGRFGRLHEGII